MDRMVALLRGVNVGGHNLVPMAALRSALTAKGMADVATYIQSGNIIYSGLPTDKSTAAAIERLIADHFDVDTPVILRSADALCAALDAHPWTTEPDNENLHHIMFLAEAPPPDADTLLADRIGGNEQVAVLGREVHVHYADGSARSRFSVGWVDRQLGTVATARNLRTCRKLCDLLLAEAS